MSTKTVLALPLLALLAAPLAAQDIYVRSRFAPPEFYESHRDTRVTQPDPWTTDIYSESWSRDWGFFHYNESRTTDHTTVTLGPGTTYFEYSEYVPVVTSRTVVYGPYGPTVTTFGPTYLPGRRIVIRR